jgi:hypothetical protein
MAAFTLSLYGINNMSTLNHCMLRPLPLSCSIYSKWPRTLSLFCINNMSSSRRLNTVYITLKRNNLSTNVRFVKRKEFACCLTVMVTELPRDKDGPTHAEGTNSSHCLIPASTYPYLERAAAAGPSLANYSLIIGCSKRTKS